MSGDKPVVVDVPTRLVTVKPRSGAPDVQRFDVAKVNNAIDKAMQSLPPNKTVAAIAYVDRFGANVAIVGKLPKIPGSAEWTILATRRWAGYWEASASVRWSI